ncbi:mCG1030251 [Mus musculus]|nr:mCG1030251 [Mus musculus]
MHVKLCSDSKNSDASTLQCKSPQMFYNIQYNLIYGVRRMCLDSMLLLHNFT